MRGKWLPAVALAMMVPGTAGAGNGLDKGSDSYDEVFARYLRQARASAEAPPPSNDWSWMSRLALDHRARSVNDLLTIRVVESITATGSADAATSKSSQAGIGVASLFGIEKKLPDAFTIDREGHIKKKKETSG